MQAWTCVRDELLTAHTAVEKALGLYSRNPPNDRANEKRRQELMAIGPTILPFFGSRKWFAVLPPDVVAAEKAKLRAFRTEAQGGEAASGKTCGAAK